MRCWHCLYFIIATQVDEHHNIRINLHTIKINQIAQKKAAKNLSAWLRKFRSWNFALKFLSQLFLCSYFSVYFLRLFFFTFWKIFITLQGVSSYWDNCVLRCLKTKTNNSLVVCGYLIISTHSVVGYCLSCSELFALLMNKPLAAHDTCFNRYLGQLFPVRLNMALGSQWKKSLMMCQKLLYKGPQ